MITVVPVMKAAPGWSPMPFQAPGLQRRLGQSVVATPTTPPGGVVLVPGMEPLKPAFFDSALVSAVMSGLGATSFGYLSYIFGSVERHTWSKIFFGLSALFGLKTLWDVYHIRTR